MSCTHFTLILHNVFNILLAIVFSEINYVDAKLTGGNNNEANVASANVTDANAKQITPCYMFTLPTFD